MTEFDPQIQREIAAAMDVGRTGGFRAVVARAFGALVVLGRWCAHHESARHHEIEEANLGITRCVQRLLAVTWGREVVQ